MNFSSNFSYPQKRERKNFNSNEYESLDKNDANPYENFPNISIRDEYDQIVLPVKKYLKKKFFFTFLLTRFSTGVGHFLKQNTLIEKTLCSKTKQSLNMVK